MKKITAYMWAFFAVLILFFTVGLCTLGSNVSYGNSLTVVKNQTVYFQLPGETIKSIYVNVGAVHTKPGEQVVVTVKTSTSSSKPSQASWSALTETSQLGNLTGKDGAQHNWYPLTEGQSRSGIYQISFTATANLELNEIVCLGTDNKILSLTPYTSATVYEEDELEASVDAQDSFARYLKDGVVEWKNSAYINFAQEEGYYMSAVQNLLSGNEKYEGASYTIGENYNYLATLLMAPSVAIFGNSVFALRLPAFLATCVLLVFAFLLIRELTKSDRYAFYFSLLLAFGGLMTTVGRFGAPYSILACALVGSVYFMYRFFAKGISSKNILRGGMTILLSGLFAAVAMAMTVTAVIPVVGVLVLFGFGLRRQKLAYDVALAKTAGMEETVTGSNGETVVVNKAENKVREDYQMKTRVSYGLAVLSFVMATFILILLAGVLAYSACVRAYGDISFLSVIWKGLTASVRDSGLMTKSAANASSVFAWWLPWKPATLLNGLHGLQDGQYMNWSVLPNIVATSFAAIAFLGVTVKVVLDIVAGEKNKETLRLRRGYILLFGGMVAAMLAGWAYGNVSALSGLLFQVMYFGFLPLAATLLPKAETKKEQVWIDVICGVVVTLTLAAFIISLPATYGYVVSLGRAKWFTWMSIVSNGFFRA